MPTIDCIEEEKELIITKCHIHMTDLLEMLSIYTR